MAAETSVNTAGRLSMYICTLGLHSVKSWISLAERLTYKTINGNFDLLQKDIILICVL